MNIVNTLTIRHLKENKGRTLVTTMGIIVSVAMITAVFVALSSFMNLFAEITYLGGHYEATLDVNQTQLEQIKKDERISNIGIMYEPENDSYCLTPDNITKNTTGSFYTFDKVGIIQNVTGDYEGTLPERENEIAVEQEFIDKNNLGWKVGDIVKIPVGTRYQIENGQQFKVNGFFTKNETFVTDSVQDFKITAILNNNPGTSLNCSIIRCFDYSLHQATDSDFVTALIQLKEVNYKSLDVIKDIIKQNNIENYYINTDYLEMHFAFSEDSMVLTSLLPLLAVVLVIILIASVVLIYNAFAMSISERVRYLGMLASVGATKKQKRLSVFYEGAILGAVGIPLGILAGVVGIGVTLKLIGGKIIETSMINGVTSDNMEMKIVVPPYVLAVILLISIFTIFISSVIPAVKASRITPIDAIRQSKEIKVKSKRLKSSNLVRLIFGYEGELANKNLKRNGRKARTITASIALSVILFLACNYFCSAFTQALSYEADVPYQLSVLVDSDKADDFKKELDTVSGIDNYYCVNSQFCTTPETTDNDYGWKLIDDKHLTKSYSKLFKSQNALYINAVDDEAFNKICEDNSLNFRDYYGENKKALLMNNISHKDNSSKVFNDSVIGVSIEDFAYKGVTIGALIDYNPDYYAYNLNPPNSISLYMPYSQVEAIVEDDKNNSEDASYEDGTYVYFYQLGIETKVHSDVYEKVTDILDNNDYGSNYCQDIAEDFQIMNTIIFIVEVLVYGFIALISLITVFNIVNTISTGVAMRKKEFAMLKSVGMTPKGFNKMLILETFFYGFKALIFSLPISAGLSFLMYNAVGMNSFAFQIDFKLYAVVSLVVMAIIGLTMLYSVNKVKKQNIIESLKEDIS